jgi:hypothetical protein
VEVCEPCFCLLLALLALFFRALGNGAQIDRGLNSYQLRSWGVTVGPLPRRPRKAARRVPTGYPSRRTDKTFPAASSNKIIRVK